MGDRVRSGAPVRRTVVPATTEGGASGSSKSTVTEAAPRVASITCGGVQSTVRETTAGSEALPEASRAMTERVWFSSGVSGTETPKRPLASAVA